VQDVWVTPEEAEERGNANVRRLLDTHTDGKILKAFDRVTREW